MTAHFFTNTKVASEAYRVAVDAMDGIDHAYRQAEDQIKSLSKQRADLKAKRDAAREYLKTTQRYHVGDILEHKSGGKYILSMVVERVDDVPSVFAYLVGISEGFGYGGGGRWSDSKGPVERLDKAKCFREGLTQAQFERVTGCASDEFTLLGTTSQTLAGRTSGRGLPRLRLEAVAA